MFNFTDNDVGRWAKKWAAVNRGALPNGGKMGANIKTTG
jgi:hypothetical protein